MSILIFAILVALMMVLLLWIVDLAAPMPSPVNRIAKVLVLVIAVLLIASKAGLL